MTFSRRFQSWASRTSPRASGASAATSRPLSRWSYLQLLSLSRVQLLSDWPKWWFNVFPHWLWIHIERKSILRKSSVNEFRHSQSFAIFVGEFCEISKSI
jgi:hypothetical protein